MWTRTRRRQVGNRRRDLSGKLHLVLDAARHGAAWSRVPSSNGIVCWSAAAIRDWFSVAFRRTLALGGVLGNEWRSFGGFSNSSTEAPPEFQLDLELTPEGPRLVVNT